MSEVKRYEMEKEVSLDINIIPTESSKGGFVLYEDYAELKAQRDALAVGISVMDAIHDKCVFITDDDYNACPKSVQEIIRSLAVMKMPATEAHLNAVRAEAIRDFWSASLADVGHVLEEIGAYQDASEAAGIVHDELKERVEDFAAQLRAGAPKGDSE